MLSFFGNDRIYCDSMFLNSIRNRFELRKKNTMSLQVLCSPLIYESLICDPEKRVLPFTSCKKYHASMTVEAAVVLPLFMFLAIALLMPMRFLDTERKIKTTMEKIGEELSLTAYMEETTEDEEIFLEYTYRKEIPFFSVASGGIKTEIAVKRRGWIGFDGKIRGEKSDYGDEENSEEMVYVGKGMGRYHIDRNCHYISNVYQAVSVDEAKKMKDADGHRFTACGTCKDTIGKSGTVYVTPGGRNYHGKTDCSAMVSYVRKVPISEVHYLGACSYCSGDK